MTTKDQIRELYQSLDTLLYKAEELHDNTKDGSPEWWGLGEACEGINRAMHDLNYWVLNPPNYPDEED